MADRQEPGTTPGKRFVGSGNDAFTCSVCGLSVLPLRNGSYRSHCPGCLWSVHVDVAPGDRAANCGGLMEPVALDGSASAGWSIVHVCRRCGARRRNRAAEDDPRQPDSWERMVEISARGGG
jgi:hypothetical protein